MSLNPSRVATTPARAALRDRLDRAAAELDPPFAVVDLDAFEANADALTGRADGKPLRVASKSVRCRHLLAEVLARPGWRGVMAFSLPEAIWLHRSGTSTDIVLGYPVAHRAALAELAGDAHLAADITLMIDSIDQLDFIDSVLPPPKRATLRVCIDLDASWRPFGERLHLGVRRSPLRRGVSVRALAAQVARRAGFQLVGLMSYEAHIAGLGDAPAGRPFYGAGVRWMQRRSFPDVVARRAEAVAAASEYAPLEFVNGGGTGSVALTSTDPSVTEVTVGSGLLGPTLFDEYRAWRPTPAAFFATSVVRRPAPGIATVHGAGWIASGPGVRSRLPRPVLPEGLSLLAAEGAGEVQTPVAGAAANGLRVGDRVWFRHAKAGELCEHVDQLHLVRESRIECAVPTYRGEHPRVFL